MGVCGGKNQVKDPQKNDQKQKQQEESQPSGLFEFVQFQFKKLQDALPFKKQPQPQQEKKGNIGDQVVQTQQQGKVVTQYDQIKSQIKPQEPFVDKEFPPDQKSLSRNVSQFKPAQNVVWKRPNQFLNSNELIKVFEGQIEPNDIKQGALGDCYFLSALSAIAEQPGLIKKLFITQEYQEEGVYGIWLCNDGEFVQIVMDDYIPCTSNGGPVFSRSNGNELWVLLLEKAYAKIYGTYEKIESGLAGHALRDLTGAPYEYFIKDDSHSEADPCWDFIIKNYRKNYIQAASSENSTKGVEYENSLGIVSQHCYAILNAQEVVGSDGMQDRIIKLRNPWGHKEWKGDWSDGSSKWTDGLKQKFRQVNKDDGVFWISVRDFIKEFSQVCVCKVHQDYQYTAIKLNDVPKNNKITRNIILMRVFQKTHLFLTLTQEDKRHYAKDPMSRYSYSLARMIIGKIDQNTTQINTYAGDAFDNDRDLIIEANLDAGDYAIYVEMDWTQDIVRELVVSSYGNQAVAFQESQMSEQIKTQILDGLLVVHQDFSDKEKNHDYGEGVKRVSYVVGGYLYLLYQNHSQGSTLKETYKMNNRKNLEICPPFTNSDEFKVEVKAGKEILVKYRVTKDGNGQYSYSSSMSFLLVQEYNVEQLKQLAEQKPTKSVQRKLAGDQPIDVHVNTFNYNAGVAILYINRTNQTYTENLKLTLDNLRVDEGGSGDEVKIVVSPQQKYLLGLRQIDTSKGTSYQMKMSYSLS